jgi:hypothetical protein
MNWCGRSEWKKHETVRKVKREEVEHEISIDIQNGMKCKRERKQNDRQSRRRRTG